jgi:hypothetical protein
MLLEEHLLPLALGACALAAVATTLSAAMANPEARNRRHRMYGFPVIFWANASWLTPYERSSISSIANNMTGLCRGGFPGRALQGGKPQRRYLSVHPRVWGVDRPFFFGREPALSLAASSLRGRWRASVLLRRQLRSKLSREAIADRIQ